ncbi:MAG: succinate dehydrogenase, cytochrome b556 subunit [Gammaproteobacteria bacterium]|nr:succinate dehydrogenase, cytochrome b556 subunit [Gammaproteobacteria bacterium]
MRPRDSGLSHMRLPIGAVTSILHRMTGVLLIAVVAAALVILHRALGSVHSYGVAGRVLASPAGRILGPVSLWITAHHTYGGIRHLALDAGFVRGRRGVRRTAAIVLVAALCTGLAAAVLWP